MKKIIYFSFLALIGFTWACRKDFIVENIDNKTVTVNAPVDNASTSINLVSFWWEPLDGAEKYSLQIVKPSFANAVQLLVDTNIVTTKFNFTLKPGTYQWRIKATNAAHNTAFQVFNLKIDTTSDLTEQFVELISPIDNAITGNKVVTFTWGSISVAQKYRLKINEGLILDTTLTGNTTLTYTLPAINNGVTTYSWNVKAINDKSQSQFNTKANTVTVDKKGPSVPVLTSPVNGTIIAQTDSLRWTHATDTKYDSVYVADDSLFIYNADQREWDVNKISVSELNRAAGVYYWWKIRSFDVYGNASSYSAIRKFKIGP